MVSNTASPQPPVPETTASTVGGPTLRSAPASGSGSVGILKKPTPLGLNDDLLSACVSCGLCLPHCPTYRATEEESASPRGRITLMRAVEQGAVPLDDEFATFMDRCVMCRGCETACPSGVHFGELMEQTRTVLAAKNIRPVPRWLRVGLRPLGHHRLLLFGSSLLGLAQRVGLVPKKLQSQLGLPARIPIRQTPLTSDRGAVDAWLFTGCVMDAWQRDVHEATLRVMRATGATVGLAGASADCCGALHAHAGLHDEAERLAHRVMRTCPGLAPIVVNSAGCGAALKDYGNLLRNEEAREFSERVVDVNEWLAGRMDLLPKPSAAPQRPVVAIQDPCHLRHVQKAHLPVRTVLAPFADCVELDDDGRCCGAGGSYQITQPELAEEIRAQKITVIAKTGAPLVASANPGCSLWLEAGGVKTAHPMQIIDEALGRARIVSPKP
jgi:glycolate oxidase iron-sulfur subunit